MNAAELVALGVHVGAVIGTVPSSSVFIVTLRQDLDLLEAISMCSDGTDWGRGWRSWPSEDFRRKSCRGRKNAAQETLGRAPSSYGLCRLLACGADCRTPDAPRARARMSARLLSSRRPHDAAQGHVPVVDLDDDVLPPSAGAEREGLLLVDFLVIEPPQLVVFEDFLLCCLLFSCPRCPPLHIWGRRTKRYRRRLYSFVPPLGVQGGRQRAGRSVSR